MWKILLNIQGNFWYNLERHRTNRNDYMAEESNFCRFLHNGAPKHWKLNIECSKKLFLKTYWSSILVRRNFSTHFPRSLSIRKIPRKVQGNFWYDLEHHTTHRNDSVAGESNFCRFLQNEAPKQPKSNPKRGFFDLTMLRFRPLENFLRIFWAH